MTRKLICQHGELLVKNYVVRDPPCGCRFRYATQPVITVGPGRPVEADMGVKTFLVLTLLTLISMIGAYKWTPLLWWPAGFLGVAALLVVIKLYGEEKYRADYDFEDEE